MTKGPGERVPDWGDDTYETAPCHCPWCGKGVDMATGVGDEKGKPVPGSASVCLYCAQVNIFTEDLTLRRATSADIQSMPVDKKAYLLFVQKVTRGFDRTTTHRTPEDMYHDSKFPERACDRCGKLYTGPAVYCSLTCALEDA